MRNFVLLLVIMPLLCLGQQKNPKAPCGSDEIHLRLLKEDAEYKRKVDENNQKWQEYAIAHTLGSKSDDGPQRRVAPTQDITLNIVFHDMKGPGGSFLPTTDYSYIVNAVNDYFDGTTLGPGMPVSNDTHIRFCLALKGKDGQPYTGTLPQHNTSVTTVNRTNYANVMSVIGDNTAASQFSTSMYINVYIVDDIADVVGFSSLAYAHGQPNDGIFIERAALQNGATFPQTVTSLVHELGHYMGLYHTFGICEPSVLATIPTCACDNGNCFYNGDMVCDTPPNSSTTDPYSCNPNTNFPNTCNTDASPLMVGTTNMNPITSDVVDPKNNIMDYSYASCRYQFTDGQILRMRFMIDPEDGIRRSLLGPSSCISCGALDSASFLINTTLPPIVPQIAPNSIAPATFTFGTVDTFWQSVTISWDLHVLGSTISVFSGIGTTFTIPSSVSLPQNHYEITMTVSNPAVPGCTKVVRRIIEVVEPMPTAGCATIFPSTNSDWGNVTRRKFEEGWTLNAATYQPFYATSISTDLGATTDDIGYGVNDYASDPILTAAPPSGVNIIRVGPRLNEPSIPQGSAYYAKITLHPTEARCRYRVYYIGAAEGSLSNVKYSGFNEHTNDPSDAAFGFLCQYKYHSPISSAGPTQMSRVGMSDNGLLVAGSSGSALVTGSEIYAVNDMVSGRWNSPASDFTPNPIDGNIKQMTIWKTMDLDFSNFTGLNTANSALDTEITITFFAHANDALNALQGAYAYFAVECLGGGLPESCSLDLVDMYLGCGETTAFPLLTKPPYMPTQAENANQLLDFSSSNRLGKISVKKRNLLNGLFENCPNCYSGGIIIDPATDAPYATFQVTMETLHGTCTDELNIFTNFVSPYSCSPGTLLSPSLNATVICSPTDTLPLLDMSASGCSSQVLSMRWQRIGITLGYGEDLQITSAMLGNNQTSEFRREVSYTNPYCNSTNKVSSSPFYIYRLDRYDFSYTASPNNICMGDTVSVDVSDFKLDPSKRMGIPASLTNGRPQNHHVSVQLYTPATGPLGNTFEADFGSDESGFPSGANFPAFNLDFANINNSVNPAVPYFIPTTTNNEFWIGLRITYTIFGCTTTIEKPQFFKLVIKPSAFGGVIIKSGDCPPISLVNYDSIAPITFPAGNFKWQQSYNDGNTWADITGGPTTETFPNVHNFFATYPVMVRRVAFGTGTCSSPNYSNGVVINGTSVVPPTFNFPTTLCQGSTPPTLPTQSANGVQGTWSPSTISTVTPGTTQYCFTPLNNQCTSPLCVNVTVTPGPTPHFSFPTNLCFEQVPFTLPLQSSDAIPVTGTWNVSAITTSGTYIFTPTNACASPVAITVQVDLPKPTFTGLQTTYCAGSTLNLPTVSSNNYAGQWTHNINMSQPGSYTATFTPTGSTGTCRKYITTIVVTAGNIVPTFSFPTQICQGTTAFSLPTTSTNNIQGNWNFTTVDNTVTKVYTFTPAPGQCATPVSVTVNVSTNCGLSLHYPRYVFCELANADDMHKEYFTDLEGGECITVCRSSSTTYSLTGGTQTIANTVWNITGGTKTSSSNTAVTVSWTASDFAYLQGIITFTDGTTANINKCIEVIAAPAAKFSIVPFEEKQEYEVCVNSEVYFENLSNAGGGNGNLYYTWSFDDGTFSNEFEPMHVFQRPGNYRVTLLVTNGCGCSSTTVRMVRVGETEIAITCNSTTCENEVATYSIDSKYEDCDGTVWSIIGGTILDYNQNNTIVTVLWDNVDADGFGYLTVRSTTNCFCATGGTIKVPVVKNVGTVVGPGTICATEQALYSLPKWPSTEYNWELGTNDAMATLDFTNQRNEIAVTAAQNGTVELICHYTNTLLNCAGTARKFISVSGAPTLQDPPTACTGIATTYTVIDASQNPAPNVSFNIKGPNNYSTSGISNSAGEFTKTFNTVGEYVFTPTGTSCAAQPVTLTVVRQPTAPTAITGPTSDVCTGTIISYTVPAQAGMTANWTVTGGSFVGGSTGNTVSIVFSATATYPYQVGCSYANTYCSSPVTSIAVMPKNPVMTISGPANAAGSCATTYSIPSTSGESFVWTITPPSRGTVISGQNTTTATILWNNGPATATVNCTAMVCGRTFTQPGYTVTVLAPPTASISVPNSVLCGGGSVNFVAGVSSGAVNSVTWNFGDGAIQTVTGSNTVSHEYEASLIGTAAYEVVATIHFQTNAGCSLSAQATTTISVKPGPTVDINPKQWMLCPIGSEKEVTVTVQDPSTCTVQWYKVGSNTVYPPQTPDSSGNATHSFTTGSYFAVVTNAFGCSRTTATVTLGESCGGGTIEGPTQEGACADTEIPTINVSAGCGQVSASLSASGAVSSTTWSIDGMSVNPTLAGAYSFAANIPPGHYTIHASVNFPNGCTKWAHANFDVPYLPDLQATISCSGTTYSADLLDYSTYAPGVGNPTVRFRVDNGPWTPAIVTGGVRHLPVSLTPGNHTAYIQVSAPGYPTCTGGPITIAMPQNTTPPDFQVVGPACSNAGTQFQVLNPQPGNIYKWEFDDLSSNSTQNVQKQLSQGSQSVTLTVTNIYGCSTSKTKQVSVTDANMAGYVDGSPTSACIGSAGITMHFNSTGQVPPSQYTWYEATTMTPLASGPSPNFSVTTSGLYTVYIRTANGCEVTNTNAFSVVFTPPPAAPPISGNAVVCEGEAFHLSVPPKNDVNYHWYFDGVLCDECTGLFEVEGMLPAGDHLITVNAKLTTPPLCEGPAGSFTLHVVPQPEAPQISFTDISCGPYRVTATVANAQPGVQYKWSNGTQGVSTTLDHDGPISVTAVVQSCSATTEIDLPVDVYRVSWIFPTGCYEQCDDKKFQGYVVGPYGLYQSWEYAPGPAGTNTPVSNYTDVSPGGHSFSLSNGDCTVTRASMDISLHSCENCKLDIKDVKIELDKETGSGPCRHAVQLVLHNTIGAAMFVTLETDPTLGYFDPATLSVAPGTNIFNLYFYPTAAFASGGNLPVHFEGLYDVGKHCQQESVFAFGACQNTDRQPAPGALQGDPATSANGFVMAPNPTHTEVTVYYHLLTGDAARVMISDLLGRTLKSVSLTTSSGNVTLDTAPYEAGTYVVRLMANGKCLEEKKLIIRHE